MVWNKKIEYLTLIGAVLINLFGCSSIEDYNRNYFAGNTYYLDSFEVDYFNDSTFKDSLFYPNTFNKELSIFNEKEENMPLIFLESDSIINLFQDEFNIYKISSLQTDTLNKQKQVKDSLINENKNVLIASDSTITIPKSLDTLYKETVGENIEIVDTDSTVLDMDLEDVKTETEASLSSEVKSIEDSSYQLLSKEVYSALEAKNDSLLKALKSLQNEKNLAVQVRSISIPTKKEIDTLIIRDTVYITSTNMVKTNINPDKNIVPEFKEKPNIEAINKKEAIHTASVYFKLNQTEIMDTSAITNIALELLSNKDFVVLLRGETDGSGTNEYNLKLSKLRVEKIKKHLLGLGVNKDQIYIQFVGEEKATQDISASHRRVLIQVFNL